MASSEEKERGKSPTGTERERGRGKEPGKRRGPEKRTWKEPE